MTALLATARAIHFASLMTIFGGSTYAALLRAAGFAGPSTRATRVLFAIAASLAIASGTVWLCLIAGQMSGRWQDSLNPAIIEMVGISTRFGHIFLGRFIGLVALWLMCAREESVRSAAIVILAGLLLASLGPVSHAAAGGDHLVSVGAINDAVHLLTAGFWLGALVVLAIFLRRNWGDPSSLVGALRIFSAWGTVAVALLVISGLLNTISILPVSATSFHNSYFDLLALKVGLASIMIGLASANRWRFAPAVRFEAGAVQHLAVSVAGEIVLGLTVVTIAAVLGITSPH